MTPSPNGITRRDALKRTFIFSAALLTPAALSRLFAQSASPSYPAGGLHLLALADFGSGTPDQLAVARQMEQYAARLPTPPAAVLALGDNFYGKWTADRFQSGFEQMYRPEHLLCPFYVCLGNHDYEEQKLSMQLAYPRENPRSRWKLPAKWYSVEIPSGSQPMLRLIVLDSNHTLLSPAEQSEQTTFLERQLTASTTAPWTIVTAHHPLFSNGPHKDSPTLISQWGPLLTQARVPLYLCGHDHLMQHLEIQGYLSSFVITGGGGAGLHVDGKTHDAYALSSFGFTHLHLTPQSLTVRLLNAHSQCLHAFSRSRDGVVTTLPA
ncbi:metallophosphoesterase [soil metagenome]